MSVYRFRGGVYSNRMKLETFEVHVRSLLIDSVPEYKSIYHIFQRLRVYKCTLSGVFKGHQDEHVGHWSPGKALFGDR